MTAVKDILYQKVGKPVVGMLRQGTSPARLAASLALGGVVGVFPLVGATTAACAALALLLRLNLPAIQLANYIVYPLQIALLIPFWQMGAALFDLPAPALSMEELTALLSADLSATVASFLAVFVGAAVVWLAAAVPLFAAAFVLLATLFRRISGRQDTVSHTFRLTP